MDNFHHRILICNTLEIYPTIVLYFVNVFFPFASWHVV